MFGCLIWFCHSRLNRAILSRFRLIWAGGDKVESDLRFVLFIWVDGWGFRIFSWIKSVNIEIFDRGHWGVFWWSCDGRTTNHRWFQWSCLTWEAHLRWYIKLILTRLTRSSFLSWRCSLRWRVSFRTNQFCWRSLAGGPRAWFYTIHIVLFVSNRKYEVRVRWVRGLNMRQWCVWLCRNSWSGRVLPGQSYHQSVS